MEDKKQFLNVAICNKDVKKSKRNSLFLKKKIRNDYQNREN